MMKFILGLALMLGITTPALATVDNPALPPENVNVMVVSAGKLYNGDMVQLTSREGKTIIIHMNQCTIRWETNDPFYLIASPSSVLAVPVYDFQTVYSSAGRNWDFTISYLFKTSKICAVTPAQ